MKSQTLYKALRIAVSGIAACCLIVCGYVLPKVGTNITKINPEYSSYFYPWLIFLLVATLPLFAILILIWKISTKIKKKQVFTNETLKLVKNISNLLIAEVSFFILGNIVLLLSGMSHPVVLLASVFIGLLCFALIIICQILLRYLSKAIVLQEEFDSTI